MIDREQFLKPRLPERVVDIPGAGPVRVRALRRDEVLEVQPFKDDLGALERGILRRGLVDPELDDDDVAVWYGSAPSGDIDLVVTAIAELSGITPDASKSGVPGPGGQRP